MGRADAPAATVFGNDRKLKSPPLKTPRGLRLNERMKMDGRKFLSRLPDAGIPVAFFDPQYRGVLDRLGYGNEGQGRGRGRCELQQMPPETIRGFVTELDRVLMQSGHLFLWMDKFHLCSGFSDWLADTSLEVVDMLTWEKGRLGMGYRSRRISEHLVVLQKRPTRAKGVWKVHTIPDVWREAVPRNGHAHRKPMKLQAELIAAVSNDGDTIIDPAAGSFSVLEACRMQKRNFLGCDLNG